MMEEPASNIAYNIKLQRSQVFQLRFDATDDFSYYDIPKSDCSVNKLSTTPTYECSEWRTNSPGTEDGFSDDASESTDMESHSPDFATFTAGLSPPPCMPRNPSTEQVPRSIALSDRRAQCRLSFGLPSDNESDDSDNAEDSCFVASGDDIVDADKQSELLKSIFDEQQEEITLCRERIARMAKRIQEQSKSTRDMMQTIHHRDEDINKMQMAMNRFRRLLKLKDKDIQDLLKIIQESC